MYPTGGTVGLFTGASILSLIEVVFWIYKVIENQEVITLMFDDKYTAL